MTLLTGAELTLDRLQYTVQIRSVQAELALLPATSHAQILIAAGVNFEAEPGTDAQLSLDGGDGASSVMTGQVQSIRRSPEGTTVTIADASADLAQVRTNKTFNGALALQVISDLAGLADVDTGLIVATTQTSAYVGDPRRSAAEHIARLAADANSIASIDADGRLSVLPWPVGIPTVAMRVDREFTAITTTAARAQHERALVGAGGSGVAIAPDAWLVNTEPVTNADDPEPMRSWAASPALRTSTDVDLANKAATARRAAATREICAECWLQPARRPGDVLQIQETTHDDQAGPWMLTTVTHELGWDRSQTRLQGVSAGSADGLLGALGSLGGLL